MPGRSTVTVTQDGVDRHVRRRLRADIRESIRWRDLERVLIVAEASLAGEDDVFILLVGKEGGVALGYSEADRSGVLARLHALPGYDHHAVVEVAVSPFGRAQVWPATEPQEADG